jgi:hypothetical protein
VNQGASQIGRYEDRKVGVGLYATRNQHPREGGLEVYCRIGKASEKEVNSSRGVGAVQIVHVRTIFRESE